MDAYIKEAFWLQFGASIDMLENALVACPEKLWDTDSKFWYIAYHTIFFLDYYLSDIPEENFLPPPPFTLSEFEEDLMPERTYTREELLFYLAYCRKKCHDLIAGLTAEGAAKPFDNEYRKYSIIEMLIYNLRHVQHHAAQLNLLLRQEVNNAPDWVSRTKVSL